MATISWEAIEARTLSLDVSDLPQWVVQPPCSARRAMARPSSARPSTARPSIARPAGAHAAGGRPYSGRPASARLAGTQGPRARALRQSYALWSAEATEEFTCASPTSRPTAPQGPKAHSTPGPASASARPASFVAHANFRNRPASAWPRARPGAKPVARPAVAAASAASGRGPRHTHKGRASRMAMGEQSEQLAGGAQGGGRVPRAEDMAAPAPVRTSQMEF